MENTQPIDYGRYLQAHRRAKGISLDLLSQRTKISKDCLHQLESEDYENLPGSTFVKGFIRAYAREVGAEAGDALKRYEAGCAIHQRMAQSQAPIPEGTSRFWGRMILAGVLLAILISATIFITQQVDRPAEPEPPTDAEVSGKQPAPLHRTDGPGGNEDEGAMQTVSPPTVPMHPVEPGAALHPEPASLPEKPSPAEPVAETMPEASEGRAPSQHLVLKVTAIETTWLQITPDQEGRPKEMTLKPGDDVTLSARTGFHLVIGNAGGLRLFLNDQPVEVPGGSGQVVRMQLP